MSVRALGIALKLTFSGTNQLFYPQTWAFALIVATCVSTQINYLNKVIVLFCNSYFSLQTIDTLTNHIQIQKVSSFSETCKFDHHDKHMRLTKFTEEIITLVISVLSRIIKKVAYLGGLAAFLVIRTSFQYASNRMEFSLVSFHVTLFQNSFCECTIDTRPISI